MAANNTIASTVSNDTNSDELTLEEALKSPEVIVFSFLLILLLIVILLGNLTVMRTVHVTPSLHYSAFYFVFSLALADFLVGFLVPFSIAYIVTQKMTNRWMAGEIACDIWTFANIWCVEASLLNLCMVSWDRYVAVTSPFSYKVRMRKKKVRVLISLVWTVSLVIGVLYTIGFKNSKERELCKATGISLRLTISFFTIVYAIPTLFLVFVNVRVIMVARNHRRHIRAQEVSPTWITEVGEIEVKNDQRKSVFLNEIKTFKTIVVIIGTFLLCYSPFFILSIISKFIPLSVGAQHVTIILFYVKSGLNPMIYGVSKDLRVAAVDSLRRRRRIVTDNTDVEKSTPKLSVIQAPAHENRAISPINIDDIRPKDAKSVIQEPGRDNRAISPINIDDIRPKDVKSVIQEPGRDNRAISPINIDDIRPKDVKSVIQEPGRDNRVISPIKIDDIVPKDQSIKGED